MKTIIAAFRDSGDAQKAADDLRASDIEHDSARVIDQPSEGSDIVETLISRNVPNERAELYGEGLRRGAAIVLVDASDEDDAERIAAFLDEHGSLDFESTADRWRSEGWTGFEAAAAPYDDTARTAERQRLEQQSIPVIEEEVRVGKREVERERMRARTFVTERPVQEEVQLREERIDVSRERVNEPVPPGTADSTFTEEEFVVTATAEEPVIEKQARVVERVNVEKAADTRTETIEETERRRDVEVEPEAPEARRH